MARQRAIAKPYFITIIFLTVKENIMSQLFINTIAQAFTKTAKSENGEVLREAIGKFDFKIDLELDLATPKMQQIITNLIIDTIKVSIQNQDRQELWDKAVIAQKFEEHAAKFTEDSLYELVCLNSNNVFGLKSFVQWVKELLIPAIEIGTGKTLTDVQKRTIMAVTKDGKRMNEQSMTKVLQWVDTYGTELENADKVINYLTNVQDTNINDLDALGI